MQECSCLHLYHKCVKIWEEVKGKKRLWVKTFAHTCSVRSRMGQTTDKKSLEK